MKTEESVKLWKPIKLFEAKAASIVIVNLMDRMLQNLPRLLCVFRIHHDPVLERLYLKVLLPRSTHLLRIRLRLQAQLSVTRTLIRSKSELALNSNPLNSIENEIDTDPKNPSTFGVEFPEVRQRARVVSMRRLGVSEIRV